MVARTSLLCVAIVAIVHAHEIGTTRVSVTFHENRTYDVEAVTDAAALAEKLATPGGTLGSRIKIVFDTVEVTPEVAYSTVPGALAIVHLSGQVPANARQFTWNYGWTFASYALTLRNDASGTSVTEWLEGGQTSAPFPLLSAEPPASRPATVWRYLTLGFTHILPHGLDHMLFVLGIYLLSGRARSVLCQISAFTAAHSITLGLSLYGVFSMPSKIVEPLIAVSIAYVAVENIFVSKLKAWRVALVFAFGLLHGMGFAGALKDVGLPRSEFLTALLSFNVGVETGQLAVIGAAFLLVGWHCANRAWYRPRVVVPASALIACIAVYWTVQRLAS
jgi:hydrogenase/urease accessory protein HupE